jgi:ribosomal protein S12 methylthiotransferase accessory factor
MLEHPTFQPHLHYEIVPNEGVFLLSDHQQTLLQGRLYELVAPCLDGRPVEQVCVQLRGQASRAEVYYTLKRLEQRGCLCEAVDGTQTAETAHWTLRGIDPALAAERLATTPVALHGLAVDTDPLAALLRSMHVELADDGPLVVVAADHYLRKELEDFNRRSLESGRPWLLVKPVGTEIWIGPLFSPGVTGCWACLAERLRCNAPLLGYLDRLRHEGILAVSGRGQTPATLAAAWGLIAQAVAGHVATQGASPAMEGQIRSVDLLDWKIETHALVKQPRCPVCGDGQSAPEDPGRPVHLERRKKAYTEDGGHRSLSPQETLDRYGRHVSPICGAVSKLERSAPVGDGVMHVYFSGNNIARQPQSLGNLRTDLRNSTCGKGTNELQAKASALCEGLERYCAIFRGDEPRRLARIADLKPAAIDPRNCMLYSEEQYARREENNSHCSIFHYIPVPFQPEVEIDWTPVWSLTCQEFRYLPTDFCYFNYPTRCQTRFCMSCSNGNAAGNCIEEAILQGFLELVERDAVGLWWYNRVQRPGVDLASFEEPYLARLAAYLQSRGRELWALDLTSDLGIPVYAALSRRLDGPEQRIMFGFGAHLDPRIAVLRAVTELNQMLVHILDMDENRGSDRLTDPETLHWLQTATLDNQPYLVPSDACPRAASDHGRLWTDDLRDDVLVCKAKVEQAGLEMLVLDHTRPEIGMPVAKVIVPGLRHFWPRFAPGRLYDVPVQLGWISEPRTEEQLNPVAMFL